LYKLSPLCSLAVTTTTETTRTNHMMLWDKLISALQVGSALKLRGEEVAVGGGQGDQTLFWAMLPSTVVGQRPYWPPQGLHERV
jgi:hypothetical protein